MLQYMSKEGQFPSIEIEAKEAIEMKKTVLIALALLAGYTAVDLGIRATSPGEYRTISWDKGAEKTSYCEMLRQTHMGIKGWKDEATPLNDLIEEDYFFRKSGCWNHPLLLKIFI